LVETGQYQTAEVLGLSLGDFECYICGRNVYEGTEKCHGFQETPEGQKQLLCSTCFQVQCTINKDSLHKKGCNGSPFVRMYLVSSDQKKVAIWKVLDHKPWLEMIQSTKES
jgi:hypothetical protein